jgi:hypothetical protein
VTFDPRRPETGQNSSYTFTIDALGHVTGVDNNGGSSGAMPGVPDVALSAKYDLNGNRTQLAASITTVGASTATPDFVDNYSFDRLNRLKSILQQASSDTGHDYVASKRTDFGYDNANRKTGITDCHRPARSASARAGQRDPRLQWQPITHRPLSLGRSGR